MRSQQLLHRGQPPVVRWLALLLMLLTMVRYTESLSLEIERPRLPGRPGES